MPTQAPVARPVNRARSPHPGAAPIMAAMFKYVACLLLSCAAAMAGAGSLGPAPGAGMGIGQVAGPGMGQAMGRGMGQGLGQDFEQRPDQRLDQRIDSGTGNAGGTVASTGQGAPDVLVAPGGLVARGADAVPPVERVLVRKSERRLYLMRGDEILRSYRIALGLRPEGSKERAGDYRTPEGNYRLARRNPNSDFFLSIQVSYPGPQDLERARRNHWNPGGSVMIHGQPNTPRHPAAFYAREDWTDGCIALSNADMVEFWRLTRENMPIDIEP